MPDSSPSDSGDVIAASVENDRSFVELKKLNLSDTTLRLLAELNLIGKYVIDY